MTTKHITNQYTSNKVANKEIERGKLRDKIARELAEAEAQTSTPTPTIHSRSNAGTTSHKNKNDHHTTLLPYVLHNRLHKKKHGNHKKQKDITKTRTNTTATNIPPWKTEEEDNKQTDITRIEEKGKRQTTHARRQRQQHTTNNPQKVEKTRASRKPMGKALAH